MKAGGGGRARARQRLNTPAAQRVALVVALAALSVTLSWSQATTQTSRSTRPSGEVVRANYPEVDLLLEGFERSHAILYQRLLGAAHAPAGRTDDSIYGELRTVLGRPGRTVTSRFTQPGSRADAVFDRAYQFRRRVYEILADSRIVDRATALEQATDDFLRQPALAVPAEPKSLELDDAAHQGHGGARMVRQQYPKVSGLVWAYQWLELALCEPLMAYDSPEERRAGVAATVSRFREMLERAPSGLPSEMPTAPAIAPSLAQRHPRAAAIFDNVHALHHVIADILVNAHADAGPAIEGAVDTFLSAKHLAVSRDEWVLLSLRRGIWWQGGPAIGKMDEPERNRRIQHAEHGRMPLPGMGELPADLREPSGGSQPRERQAPADAHGQH